MPWNERDLSALLARRLGVVAIDELRAIGLSDDAVATLVRRGRLERVVRGVYVSPATPASDLHDAALACAATSGSISHEWAGRWWGLRKMPLQARRVTVPEPHRPRWPHAQIVRSRGFSDVDIVEYGHGIRVTTPVRTVWDAATFLSHDDLASVIEQGIDRRMFGVGSLWAVARRLAAPGRSGSTAFVDVLAGRPSWVRPAGSDLELVVERSLVDIGLPPPVRQLPVVVASGVTYHLDLAYPGAKLAIEVDHITWHGGRVASTNDKQRDRHLAVLGWLVIRITDTDVRHRLWPAMQDIAAIYRSRLPSAA